jgi:hypothetical protein
MGLVLVHFQKYWLLKKVVTTLQEGLNDESEIEPSRRMVINQPDEIKVGTSALTYIC